MSKLSKNKISNQTSSSLSLIKIVVESENLSHKEIVDDILSAINEGDVDSILQKMKQYAKRGLLTLAIVTSVLQGMQAQNIDSSEINRVETFGTELVQQKQEVERVSDRDRQAIVKVWGEQVLEELLDIAEKNDAFIGVGTGSRDNIAQRKSSMRASITGGIEGMTSRRDLKTLRQSVNGQIYYVKVVKFL